MAARALLAIVLMLVAAAISWKPLKLKSVAERGQTSLARYVQHDVRHLASISSCLDISKQNQVLDPMLARECSMRLLEFSQPYHSLLAIAALASRVLDEYPNDHALRSKLLMAIAVTRTKEERVSRVLFEGYNEAKKQCEESWIATAVFQCVSWFDRPVIRDNYQVMKDLKWMEDQFAHADLDSMIAGAIQAKESVDVDGNPVPQEIVEAVAEAASPMADPEGAI